MKKERGKNPKVSLVIGQLHYGGAERQLVELAIRLPDFGFLPTVVSLSEKTEPYESFLLENGVPVKSLKRMMRFDFSRVFMLRRIFQQTGTELVHSYLHISNAYCYGALFGRRRTPLVTSVRNCEIDRNPLLKLVDKYVLERSHLIIANSFSVKDFLISKMGLSVDRIRVVRNGLDLSRFKREGIKREKKRKLGLREDRLVVGGVGRLEKQKRFDLFLLVAKKISTEIPNLLFLIAGEGSMHGTLKRQIEKDGLEDIVELVGPRTDIEDFLGAMDVFLLTSFKEGLPNVVMEAMAFEIPCVVTDVGGCREIVNHGETGFVIPFGDNEGLVKSLSILLKNNDLRKSMGKKSRKKMAGNFSVENMVKSTIEIYKELLWKKKLENRSQGGKEG